MKSSRTAKSSKRRTTVSTIRRPGARPASSMAQVRQKRNRQRARAARQKMLMKLGMLAACVALLWLAVHLLLLRSINKVVSDDTTIAQGITIDGFDVGGMTREQARDAFNSYVDQVAAQKVTLATGSNTVELSLSSFGFQQDTTNTKDLVQEAYDYGREGSVIKRFRQVRKLKKNGVDLDAAYTIDKDKTAQMLAEHCVITEGAAVNASMVHSGSTYKVEPSKTGTVVDTKTTTEAILSIVSDPEWDKTISKVAVATEEADPEITTEMLESLTDVLGSYSTYYDGTTAKMTNVENGASLINGHLVQPGESFDANAAMEPYTEENGYVEGGSFNNGQIEQTLGGGICQVSSTLYNAVLYSELEVLERSNHSMLVSYVEPGRDAAIADDVKNLVFRNNTDHPIYIDMYTENGYVYAYIYGIDERDPGRSVEYVSDVTSRKECKIIYRADYDAAFGSRTTDTYGYDGVEARLFKNIYMNGELQDTELVDYSSYHLVDAIVKVGVKTDNTEAQNALLNAISNQDEDTIRSYTY